MRPSVSDEPLPPAPLASLEILSSEADRLELHSSDEDSFFLSSPRVPERRLLCVILCSQSTDVFLLTELGERQPDTFDYLFRRILRSTVS